MGIGIYSSVVAFFFKQFCFLHRVFKTEGVCSLFGVYSLFEVKSAGVRAFWGCRGLKNKGLGFRVNHTMWWGLGSQVGVRVQRRP